VAEEHYYHLEKLMGFYRIISLAEVKLLVQSGFVPRNFERWDAYPPGTIICLFEEDDFVAPLKQFATGLGEQRNLVPGDTLYVLEFFNLAPEHMRPDSTASGWLSSRLYFAPVGAESVKIVAIIKLAGRGPDCLQPGPVEILRPPISPADVLTNDDD
jgi:hypothetical protein